MNENLKIYIKYAITTLCSFIVFRASNVIDTIFAGKFIGEKALDVTTLLLPFINIKTALLYMITSGAIVTVGKYIGEGNHNKADGAFTTSLLIIIIINIIFILFGFIFSKQIIFFLGGNYSILNDAQIYLRFYLIFALLSSLEHFFSAFMRLTNKPIIIPFLSSANTILNLIFKYFFVIIKKTGITGLALSSCCSIFIVSFLYILIFFTDNKIKLKLKIDKRIKSMEILKMLYKGMPEFLLCISSSILVFTTNKIILNEIGLNGIAAHAIYSILFYINLTFIQAFCSATTPLININFGKKEYFKMKIFLKYNIISAFITGMVVFIILTIWPMLLVDCFVNSKTTKETIQLALTIIKFGKYNFILPTIISVILINYLTAIHKSTESVILSILNSFAIPIIGVTTLTYYFGHNGHIYSIIISEYLSAFIILIFIFFKKHKYFLKYD